MKILCALIALLATTVACVKTPRRAWVDTPVPKHEVRNAQRVADGDLELQRLREKVINEPNDVVARIELAGYYDRLGMQELALEHYRLAGVRRPEDELSHLRLAQGLRQSHPEQARRELRQFVANFRVRMADTYSLLAILEDGSGDLEAGEALHRKALELEPRSDRLQNNLGFNLAQQERHPEAVKTFRRAIALNSSSDVARNNLAASLAQQSSTLARAFNAWRQSGGAAAAHNNLGAAHFRQGDYVRARQEFEESLRLNPGLSAAWRNLAKVSELDGGKTQLAGSAPAAPPSGEASGGNGWRLLSAGFKKIFATAGTDAIMHPPVTEVGDEVDPSSGRIKRQKTAE